MQLFQVDRVFKASSSNHELILVLYWTRFLLKKYEVLKISRKQLKMKLLLLALPAVGAFAPGLSPLKASSLMAKSEYVVTCLAGDGIG